MDLAKSAMAQITEALRTPMWSYEKTIRSKNGLKVDVRKGAIPAWFIVGAAVAIPVGMWILGIGIKPTTNSDGKTEVKLSERPRMVLPFGGGTTVSLL